MTHVEELEKAIQNLDEEEMAELRAWFLAFDARTWDRQFERDASAGALDGLAQQALDEHKAGKTRSL